MQQDLSLGKTDDENKSCKASASLLTISWKWDSLCTMMVQSSAKSASRMFLLIVLLVLALKWGRLSRDPSILYSSYTSCFKSVTVWLRMQVKKRLKSTGARTHSCFTPFVMLNGSEVSPRKSISPVISSWNRWITHTHTHTHTHTQIHV